jgi:hypothetical protein
MADRRAQAARVRPGVEGGVARARAAAAVAPDRAPADRGRAHGPPRPPLLHASYASSLLPPPQPTHTRLVDFPPALRTLLEDAAIPKLGANIKSACARAAPLTPADRAADDGEKLVRDFGVRCAGLVELGAIARVADPRGAPPPVDLSGRDEPPVPDGPASSPAPVKKAAPAQTADAAVRALRARGFPYARAIVALAKMVALYTGRQLLKDDVRTSDWERPLDARQRLCASLLPLRGECVR